MYTMKQVCEMTNLPYETLKYYCNIGLIPNVQRDERNRRIFDEHTVNWIKGLNCLKKCDMSIKEMKDFLALGLKGEKSVPQRKIILQAKQKLLVQKLQEIQQALDFVNVKLKFYDDILAGKTKYHSNLIYDKSDKNN